MSDVASVITMEEALTAFRSLQRICESCDRKNCVECKQCPYLREITNKFIVYVNNGQLDVDESELAELSKCNVIVEVIVFPRFKPQYRERIAKAIFEVLRDAIERKDYPFDYP